MISFADQTIYRTDESCCSAHPVHHYRTSFIERIHFPTSRFFSARSCPPRNYQRSSAASTISFIDLHRSQLLLSFSRTSIITVTESRASAVHASPASRFDHFAICTVCIYILRLRVFAQYAFIYSHAAKLCIHLRCRSKHLRTDTSISVVWPAIAVYVPYFCSGQ